ncbi:MAG: tetratricopeptide repeat protein [Bryobacteraceae bacterium]
MRRVLLAVVLSAVAPAQIPTPDAMRQLAARGDAALASARYADAAAAYEELRKLDPSSAEVLARLGLIYFQQGRFALAAPVLRQALRLKPALPNTDVLLAMSLSETGRHEAALAGLEKGFRRSTDPALRRMSGLHLQRSYTALGRDTKATEVALDMTRQFGDDAEVLYHSSRLFANYAYLAMRKLTEVAPNSVWRMLAAGETHESQGNYELAIAKYREILALEPNRPGVHYRIGRTQLTRMPEADAQAEAVRAFEREMQIDPSNANAAYELGELFRKSANLEKSREMLTVALDNDPDFDEALIAMGRALTGLGKPDQAVTHLRKAIALNKSSDVAFFHLSQAYRAMGNTTERQNALAEFRRLRAQRAGRETVVLQEVTKQEIDPER